MLRQPPFTCNSLQQSAQILKKCGTHLKTLVTRRVTKSEVYAEDAQAFSRHDDLSPAICAPLYCSFVTLPFDATQLEIIAASLKAMLSLTSSLVLPPEFCSHVLSLWSSRPCCFNILCVYLVSFGLRNCGPSVFCVHACLSCLPNRPPPVVCMHVLSLPSDCLIFNLLS